MAKRLRGRYGYPRKDPFQVTFHPDRLHEPRRLKRPAKIFTCSMGELFDPETAYGWLDIIFAEMKRNRQHVFQVLTKRPDRLYGFRFPRNLWLGVSIEIQDVAEDRLYNLVNYGEGARFHFASFEPLQGPIDVDLEGLDWIIIGAQTQPWRPPAIHWVRDLVQAAVKYDIPYFLKDNLKPLINVTPQEQQFPKWPGGP
jgi:protein gp37